MVKSNGYENSSKNMLSQIYLGGYEIKNGYRISYINEGELLDCTMELHKPNTRKKLDEKLTVMFEAFARQCKFKE